MANYQSSVAPQLSRVEREIDQYLFRQLKSAGKRFRARLVRERLSRPLPSGGKVYPAEAKRLALAKAPLARKKGLLARDVQYFVVRSGNSRTLEFVTGRRAYYAEQHEQSGRLKFREIARQEVERAREDIRIGLPLVLNNVRGGGLPATVLDAGDEAAIALKEVSFGARSDARGLGFGKDETLRAFKERAAAGLGKRMMAGRLAQRRADEARGFAMALALSERRP
jgi:hypothetical protein